MPKVKTRTSHPLFSVCTSEGVDYENVDLVSSQEEEEENESSEEMETAFRSEYMCLNCNRTEIKCRCSFSSSRMTTRDLNAQILLKGKRLSKFVASCYPNVATQAEFGNFLCKIEKKPMLWSIVNFTDFPISQEVSYTRENFDEDTEKYNELVIHHKDMLSDWIMYTYLHIYLTWTYPSSPIITQLLTPAEYQKYMATAKFPISPNELLERMGMKDHLLLYNIKKTETTILENKKSARVTTHLQIPSNWGEYMKLYEFSSRKGNPHLHQ